MRKILKNGKVILDEKDACKALLRGCDIRNLYVDFGMENKEKILEIYPHMIDHDDFSEEELEIRRKTYFMPEEYKNLNLENFFLSKIKTNEERERVLKELEMVKESGLEDFFRYLVYLSDIIKKNGIVIGTGRGSSTSLYILYLIGLHRVNSLKYGIEPNEFFHKGEKDD